MTTFNEYSTPKHALAYLAKSDGIPHRTEGEAILLELLPTTTNRVLDIGCGDGRLLALIRSARPQIVGIALDFSPVMIEAVKRRFSDNPEIEIIAHDLEVPLPDLGRFDAIVSCFAIHHLTDARKRDLYRESYEALIPGGVFCNLEHVASPTQELHAAFYEAIQTPLEKEDPSNQCVSVDTQVAWLNEIGFRNVDCFWKWRELALLAGTKKDG